MSYFGVYMPPTEAGFKGTIAQCAGSIAAEGAEKDIMHPRKLNTLFICVNKRCICLVVFVNIAISCRNVINARVFNVTNEMTPCYFSFVAHRSCCCCCCLLFVVVVAMFSLRSLSRVARRCSAALTHFYHKEIVVITHTNTVKMI